MKILRLLQISVFAFAACILSACCTVDNNDRSINELANYMIAKTGAKYDVPWNTGPVHAESGFALRIEDHQVVFLKYNTKRIKMQKKLKYIDDNGFLYIFGQKFPAMRHGSFAMLDYEGLSPANREKFIEAFKDF